MADIIVTLNRLARPGDDGGVCVCTNCGTRYDANRHGCPVCTEFSVEREAWRCGVESEVERP